MIADWASIGGILVIALLFPIIILAVSALIRSRRKAALYKYTTYECGPETEGDTWVQFKANYFMYALLFVAFDVETVFLYLWAVKIHDFGLFVFAEIFLFIMILVIGLIYDWKEGALEWE
ncbi:MAG: dehydrogenase subunit [Paenibacillaceae bacterium]|jgi:NADH-quinone oxidoreductase subunit A|nr:dehydrogenase subunit [Paenibacillaceae bacterium]